MIKCSFCYEQAHKYSLDVNSPIEVYAYCTEHSSNRKYWLNLPSEQEITESEYLLYLAMEKL